MGGSGFLATSPGSTLTAVSKINKRSESDGIVVAERPKPDKQPVRRCESTDDAGVFGSGAGAMNENMDNIKSMHTESERIQFPKNIKTVSSESDAEDTIGVIARVLFLSAWCDATLF